MTNKITLGAHGELLCDGKRVGHYIVTDGGEMRLTIYRRDNFGGRNFGGLVSLEFNDDDLAIKEREAA